MAADRLPDPSAKALREPGPVTRDEAAAMLFSGDYDHLLAGEFAAWYPLRPVSAAVSPAEPPERYVISDERLAEIRALIAHDRFGYRVLPASAQVSPLQLAAAVEDLLAERDERTDA